jgi:hypothetical protein
VVDREVAVMVGKTSVGNAPRWRAGRTAANSRLNSAENEVAVYCNRGVATV